MISQILKSTSFFKITIINKIINQANSLNKKIKKFNDEGINEYTDFLSNFIDSKYHNRSGRITKSRKLLGGQSVLELKQLLSSLIKVNNNETYGTIHKYKQEVAKSISNARDTFSDYLLNKGYDPLEVDLVINSGTFLNSVAQALNDMGGGYGSNQTMEKVFLQYTASLNEKERARALSDVEFGLRNARELAERLETERQALEELHRLRKNR